MLDRHPGYLAASSTSFPLLALLTGALLTLSACTQSEMQLRPKASLSPELTREAAGIRSLEDFSVTELLQRGNMALNEGNTRVAQTHFTLALEKEPESVAAQLGLARVVLANGDRHSARALVGQVLKKEPDNVTALIVRGRILRDQGELEAAAADFSLALLRSPDDPLFLTELAITYDRNPKRIADAETLYRRVVELLPESPGARNNLGFNLLLQGRPADAAPILSSALSFDPKNARILGNLATAHLLRGDEDKALTLFRRSVGEAKAYNNVGYLYMTQGRWSEAELAYTKALELSPSFYVRADANRKTLQALRDQPGSPPPIIGTKGN